MSGIGGELASLWVGTAAVWVVPARRASHLALKTVKEWSCTSVVCQRRKAYAGQPEGAWTTASGRTGGMPDDARGGGSPSRAVPLQRGPDGTREPGHHWP